MGGLERGPPKDWVDGGGLCEEALGDLGGGLGAVGRNCPIGLTETHLLGLDDKALGEHLDGENLAARPNKGPGKGLA